jgi:hypothetical protein
VNDGRPVACKGAVAVDNNEPVTVYTTNNAAEAEIVKNLLEAEGVRAEIAGESQGSFTGVLGVNVLVRAWDEKRARHVLALHGHRHRGHAQHADGG